MEGRELALAAVEATVCAIDGTVNWASRPQGRVGRRGTCEPACSTAGAAALGLGAVAGALGGVFGAAWGAGGALFAAAGLALAGPLDGLVSAFTWLISWQYGQSFDCGTAKGGRTTPWLWCSQGQKVNLLAAPQPGAVGRSPPAAPRPRADGMACG